MKRKFLALLLALTMCLGLLSVGVLASEDAAADGEPEPTAAAEISETAETPAPAEETPVAEEAEPELPAAPETPAAEEAASDSSAETETSEEPEQTAAAEAVNADTTDTTAVSASGVCGDNLTWTLENGTLTISGTGAMTEYWEWGPMGSESPWSGYGEFYNQVTAVVIESGVTTIGSYAFIQCEKITSLTIADTVKTIGEGAFWCCTGLTSVTIPAGVETIGAWAFTSCTKLADISIPDGVTIGENAFSNTAWLNNSTEEFAVLGGMLLRYGGTGGAVSIPDTVTSIGAYVFDWNSTVTSVTIPDSVTAIGAGAFRFCTGLTSVTIPAGVETIGECAFEDCTALTSLTINGARTIGSYAFNGCTGLTEVVLPEGLISVGACAFANCGNLASITIPESLTDIGYNAFYGTAWLDDSEEEFIVVNGLLLTYHGEGLEVVIPDGVTKIADYAFRDGWNVEKIGSLTIPDSVTEIGDCAFQGCYSLHSLTIPDSVTAIGDYCFSDGWEMESLTLGSGVKTIGRGAFSGCVSLTSLTIPAGVTEIGDGAFRGCESLTSIEVAADNAGYKSVDGVLYSKDGSTLVQYPLSKTGTAYSVPAGVTDIVYGAFTNCASLASVTLPDGMESISAYAFAGCGSLKDVTIPDSVTNIVYGAFADCTGLTGVSIPDSVTEIGDDAFNGCTGLTGVTVPDSVQTIGCRAFYGCTGVESAVIGSGVKNIYWYAFGGCTGLQDIVFMGNAPTYIEDEIFPGVTANAWYYSDTEGWTDDVKADYGGNLTWDTKGLKYIQTTIGSDPEAVVTAAMTDGSKWKENITLVVAEVEDADVTVSETAAELEHIENAVTYDISLSDGESVVTLDEESGGVTVRLPVPDGFDGEKCQVFRVEEDGTLTALKTFYEDGELRFVTEHFSQYMVAEMKDSYFAADTGDGEDPGTGGEDPGTGGEDPGTGGDKTGVVASGSAGENLTWTLDSDGTLTISGSGDMVIPGDAGWDEYSADITKIVINEGVTSIKTGAFHGYTSLTGVSLPKSLKTIGSSAFEGCTALTSVTIPAGVTEIGEAAFADCSSLKNVTFNGNAPTVKQEGGGELKPVFDGAAPDIKITYYKGTTGWTDDVMTALAGAGSDSKWSAVDESAGPGGSGGSGSGTGSGTGNDSGNGSEKTSPKTGDGTNIALWAVLLVLCGGGCAVLVRRKLRKN